MENKQGTDYLNNPDEFLSVSNTEQLMEEFGDMFEETMLYYRMLIYLEKNQYGDNPPEERFFVTPTSFITLKGDGVWDMDKNDQEFLSDVYMTLSSTKVTNNMLGKYIVIHDKNIKVTYKPYTAETSDYVIKELKRREELLQKRV